MEVPSCTVPHNSICASGNAFFHYIDRQGRVNSRLALHDILVLLYIWLYARMPVRHVEAVTGHSQATIVDWNNFSRTTCGKILDTQPKLVGTGEAPVKIDESYMCGRRKYGKGRLLAGDRTTTRPDTEELPGWNGSEQPSEEEEEGTTTTDFVRFGEDDLSWRWVVGIWKSSKQCRFVRVPNRTKKTMNAVITRYVASGSHIQTDMWGGYNDLNELGYVHSTVNHSENYVDPESGAHTNDIEGAWNIAKAPYKRMRGNRMHLQSHLDEAAWRMLRQEQISDGRLLNVFLDDVRAVHGQLTCLAQ
eukprot:IDg22331t1